MVYLYICLMLSVFLPMSALAKDALKPEHMFPFVTHGTSEARSTAFLRDGSMCIAGNMADTCIVGSDTLISHGEQDILLVVLSQTGKTRWYLHAGGPEQDIAFGVAVDKNNKIYVYGSCGAQCRIGDFPLDSKGSDDGFIICLNEFGRVLWRRIVGGPLDDRIIGGAVRNGNGIVVTGSFKGQALFDQDSVIAQGGSDLFAAGFDTTGTMNWFFSGKNQDDACGQAVFCDTDDIAYVTGWYERDIDIGGVSLAAEQGETAIGDPLAMSDMIVAAIDHEGRVLWSRTAGGASFDQGTGIMVMNNSIYVCGEIQGKARFSGGIFPCGSRKFDCTTHLLRDMHGRNPRDSAQFKRDSLKLECHDPQCPECQTQFICKDTILETHGSVGIFLARYTIDGSFRNACLLGGKGKVQVSGLIGIDTKTVAAYGLFTDSLRIDKKCISGTKGWNSFLALFHPDLSFANIAHSVGRGNDGFWGAAARGNQIYSVGTLHGSTQFDSCILKTTFDKPQGFGVLFNCAVK